MRHILTFIIITTISFSYQYFALDASYKDVNLESSHYSVKSEEQININDQFINEYLFANDFYHEPIINKQSPLYFAPYIYASLVEFIRLCL